MTPASILDGSRTPGRWLLLGFVLFVFGAGFFKAFQQPRPALFQMPRAAEPSKEAPRLTSRFVSTSADALAHAASLIELKDGRIRAFWYSGSGEGALDVDIRSAVFDPGSEQWSPERSVATRASTERAVQRFVTKLGNPVPARAADGTLWLFYVTVSLGGWAGGSITAMISQDEGETWSAARRLVSAPFFNYSTLVKGAPFLYADGSMGLPVYQEFIGRFGEILRLDRTGAVLDKQRLSDGTSSLQPIVLVKSEKEALVLMRYAGSNLPNRVIATATRDAGERWTTPVKSLLPNPNAALAGLVLADRRILLALNDVEQDREVLSLVISSDGGVYWSGVYTLEGPPAGQNSPADQGQYLQAVEALARGSDAALKDPGAIAQVVQRRMCKGGRCGFEYSYPYLLQSQRGDFHLVYTWNNSFIKHVQFNRAWLDERFRGRPR